VFNEVVRACVVGILIFKGLTVRHLYKSFGVEGLIKAPCVVQF
jgi:hypothetical protein